MYAHAPGTAARSLEERLYRLTLADHLLSRRPSARGPRFAERAAAVDALYEVSGFDAVAPTPVPRLALPRATWSDFRLASADYRRPVVIRGFGIGTEAVRSWSPSALADRLGSTPCTVVEMDDAAMRRPHDSGRVLRELPFDEFVGQLDHAPLYLHNSTELFGQMPGLIDDLGLERLRAAFTDPCSTWDELFSTNLFVGSEAVFSNLHHAPGGNFFLQIDGRKTWTLVDPAYTPHLFPVISRPFNHCLSVFGSYRAAPEDSPIRRLPRLEVTLEPGDVLYNPPWWWHEVVNHGHTIGCAVRHVPDPFGPSPTYANHPLFAAASVYPKLWAFSALSYLRHQVDASAAPMRDLLNPRLALELNRARGR